MGVAGGLDFCVLGPKGPEVLGLEKPGAAIPGARQFHSLKWRELGFCFAEFWERKGLALTHHGRGPANTEPCVTKAQAPGGKEARGPDSSVCTGVMEGAGPCMPVSPAGRRDWGTGRQSPWGGKE